MSLLKTSLVVCLLLLSIPSHAQLNQGGLPLSFEKNLSQSPVDFHTIIAVQTEKLKQEDLIFDTIPEIPWRFGENIPTDINPNNAGTWQITADKGQIWQTGIASPGAVSLNLVFQPYHLPPGAKLFVYSADRKQILGAFNHRNNQEDKFFATSIIFSDSLIVEYFEPANALFKGEIGVSQVTHGYRHARKFAEKVFGESGECNINVGCDVAQPYADQIRSVALMLTGSNSFCTGALINNAENDGTPYILSANHCYKEPSTVVFWFNWESDNCQNPETEPLPQALSGAQQKARFTYNNTTKTGSDFWLMEMNHLPPYEYNLFYMGWNRADDPLTIDSVVGIHHPSGDIKKFSWSTDSLQKWGYGSFNAGYETHWRVKSWDAGTTTEGGSSGSPLLDQNGRIIGQLHGGNAACGNTLPDWYGRFAVSWDGDGTDATGLKRWLDPNGLNPQTNNGYQPVYHLLETSVGGNGGGAIDPSFHVMHNRSHTFNMFPEPGYSIMDVLADGVSVGPVNSYTFENVTQPHTLEAIFGIPAFTISSSAGENGTIDPSGAVLVELNSSKNFTITPNEGYHIEDVLADGESVGTVVSYTFENIMSDHTIHATFAINTYTLTASAGENGFINPAGEVVAEYGTSQTFAITPNEGFQVEDVLVDGESIGAVTTYTFENITEDHILHATFAINTYTITATAGNNGITDPAGEVVAEYGASQTFAITPNEGYHVEDVLVDGESIGAVTTYTFENITEDHTLHATFVINTYTITATAGDNGITDPAGETLTEYGASQTFTIIPDAGYLIAEVLVDGVNAGPVTSYTFDNIQSDHTLEASFYMPAFLLVFNITDENDQPITDAVVDLNGLMNEAGNYSFYELIAGSYPYTVSKEGYFPRQGNVTIIDQDLLETVVMQTDDTSLAEWNKNNKNNLHIYPNPARSHLHIKAETNITQVQLINITGAIVREIFTSENELVVNVSSLQPGLYVIRAQTPKGSHEQKIQVLR
jgi:hypothetical protein